MKVKIRGALFRCGTCRKSYSNPLGHVCVSRMGRAAGRTKLKPSLSAKCQQCRKPLGNPLTHTCTTRTDFKRRTAKAKKEAAAAKRAAARKARPELAEPDSDAEGDRDDEPDMPVSIPWDEHAGRRFRRAVILGDPGFGKSWLLQWETRRLALEGKRQLEQWKVSLDDLVLPILARCSELNQSDDAVEDALVRLAGQDRTEEFRRWVLWKLRNGGCVVLLDAWDEVPLEPRQQGAPSRHAPNYRERLGQRLGRFGEEFPDLRMLLSSRIVGYGGSPVTDLVEVELVAWETPQIESFVRVWFGPDGRKGSEFLDRLQRVGQVQGLARIPLMLALLCKAFERKRLSLPTTRGKLYNECLRGLLGDWKGEEDGAERVSPAYIDAVLEVLCPVGLELFSEGHDQFGVSLLRTKLLTRLDGVAPKSRTP